MEKSEEARLIELPRIFDERGNLSFIQEGGGLPFRMERLYWIYDVPGGEFRGSHAFYQQQELIIAISGSFDVVLHDGVKEQRFSLNRSYRGVYVPRMMWRSLENFSSNSLCLVLSSTPYDPSDYIWDFQQFRRLRVGEMPLKTFD